MTIRQFLSIVLSCLVFNHSLSPTQWCAPVRGKACRWASCTCRDSAGLGTCAWQ